MTAAALAVAIAAATTTPVGVSLDEFSLGLGRERVRAGTIRFNVTNFGEDPHDFVVRDREGRVRGSLDTLIPGTRKTLRLRLRQPGVYRLVCTLGDHEELGMLARMRVLRAKARATR